MGKSATKESRVRWNNGEKTSLIAEGRKVLAEKPMKTLEALALAQKILPRARRRRVASVTTVRWFTNGVAKGADAVAPAAARGAKLPRDAFDDGGVSNLKDSLVRFFADVFEQALNQAQARTRTPAARRGR